MREFSPPFHGAAIRPLHRGSRRIIDADTRKEADGMIAAWLLALSGLVIASLLAAGFRVRARLTAILAGAAGPQPGGSLPGATGPGGMSWRWFARVQLRPYYRVIMLASGLMLAETALALAAPWPLKIIIDHGLGHQPLTGWLRPLDALRPVPLAVAAAIGGLVLLAAAALLGYLVTYLMAAVGERAGLDLRLLTVNHLLRIPPAWAARHPLGELTTRVGADAARVTDTVVSMAEVLVPETAVLAGMAVITSMLDWRLTLVALAVVPLLTVTARVRNRGLRAAQRTSRQCAGDVSAQTADLLARLPSVHIFDRADTEIAETGRLGARAAAASVRALDASARFGPVAEVLPGLGLAAALITGTVEVGAGRLTVGGLVVFLAYLASLQAPVRALVRLSTTISRGEASRVRLAELLAIERPRPAGEGRWVRLARPRPAGCGPGSEQGHGSAGRGAAVDLDAVSFGYRPGQLLLHDLELHIEPGEVLCLTGPSGTGKSTVLALLMRLAEPGSGHILIGGLDTSAMPLSQLSHLVTLVPQDPWLHTGSIAANIAYGRPGASPDEIRLAAIQAGADAFVRCLPDRYHTPVGEHGHALSGGQARRIALARALLRDSPVLLLDEPTVGLDADTETDVLAHLLAATRGKTLLVVTHQPRVMALADRVVALADAQAGPRARVSTRIIATAERR
jgi:subfamily B ATP-binding cassette protein MsbA